MVIQKLPLIRNPSPVIQSLEDVTFANVDKGDTTFCPALPDTCKVGFSVINT